MATTYFPTGQLICLHYSVHNFSTSLVCRVVTLWNLIPSFHFVFFPFTSPLPLSLSLSLSLSLCLSLSFSHKLFFSLSVWILVFVDGMSSPLGLEVRDPLVGRVAMKEQNMAQKSSFSGVLGVLIKSGLRAGLLIGTY